MSRPHMLREDFCEQFVVVFLATWAATHYDDACARGNQLMLSNPPVEDARFLADKAWERCCAI